MAEPERPRQNIEDQALTVKEVTERFRDRWVLSQVIEDSDHDELTRVRVIETSRSRGKISKVLAKLPSPSKQVPPEGPYYIFHTKPFSGLRFRAARWAASKLLGVKL